MTPHQPPAGHVVGDAWGDALLDHFHGEAVPALTLEVDGGAAVPAMHPEWFFRSHDEWDWWERECLALVDTGPVLDLGAGAGRAALHFQRAGLDVTAVESSPGAAEVCRLRGVADIRVADLNDPPRDRRWGAVLLLCGNLGLGGSWEGNRRLLSAAAACSAPGALLIGDSVTSDGPAEVGLRIRYKGAATPWWRQRNVAAPEVPDLVRGTGWTIERQVADGADHAVVLRRSGHAT